MVSASPQRRAFTLIELLVVIGIIALVAGMVLFAVGRGRTAAMKARIASDLQVIATALEAYKLDFGDYPRLNPAVIPNGTVAGGVYGSQLLCWALLAPGNQAMDGAGDPNNPLLPGFGFRVRNTGQGNRYGPYLKPDNFKIAPINNPTLPAACNNTDEILDYNGHPILYYPAYPNRPVLDPTVAYVGGAGAPLFANGAGLPFLFDPRENDTAVLSQPDMQIILGDTNTNGRIDPVTNNETAAFTGPYILWSAGADGRFGITAPGKCDDITNFER